MIQKSLNLKTLRNSILVLFLSMSFSTFAQQFDIVLTNSVNVVNKYQTTINGVKTYELTIPFFTQNLNELDIRAQYSCSYNPMIVVNNLNSNYSNPPKPTLFKLTNLQEGMTTYTVSMFCNGSMISTQQLNIKIIKEATPTINLTMSGECVKEKGKYNGYVHLHATGSYTNANKLYLKNTTTTSCPTNNPSITSLGNGNLPSNTVNKAFVFKCNQTGVYTVEILYGSYDIHGNVINYILPSGVYGWNDYSYRKRGGSCTEPLIYLPSTVSFKEPNQGYSLSLNNPVKDELDIFINSEDKANYEIEIYDFSGLSVKRASLKEADSNSKNTINVQDLRKGIYIVEIKNGDSVTREKMIKE